MSTPPTSPTLFHPLDLFMANMTEVDCLTTIYAHASNYHLTTATEPVGDKHILIKSAIVFIVTCWDEYVKSLVTTAFDFMLTQANTPDIFPKQVKIVVSETLQPPYPDSQDEDPVRRVKQKQRDDWDAHQWKADIWQLAGDGWLTLLRRHQEEILQRYVERFHSPRHDRPVICTTPWATSVIRHLGVARDDGGRGEEVSKRVIDFKRRYCSLQSIVSASNQGGC